MSLIINWWNIVVLALGLIATFWCNNKYNETKSRPLLTSLPGVWTSLGLLGTFLAICLSLHDVKTAEGINADILELIRSLVPAFTTSIIGLVGALVVTIWSKVKFAQEEVEDNSKLGNMTPEEYIRDTAVNTKKLTDNRTIWAKHNELLSELIQLHKDQEEKNREYNEKLNDNISHQSEILKEFIDSDILEIIVDRFPGQSVADAIKFMMLFINFYKSYKIQFISSASQNITTDNNGKNTEDNTMRPIDNKEMLETFYNEEYLNPIEVFYSAEKMKPVDDLVKHPWMREDFVIKETHK